MAQPRPRRKTPTPPRVAPELFDEVAKELEGQITNNVALLAGLNYAFAQELLEAQAGKGEVPATERLESLKRLQLAVQSDRVFLEARELTRRKGA